eukprot:3083138-Rhodomonas_salina.2
MPVPCIVLRAVRYDAMYSLRHVRYRAMRCLVSCYVMTGKAHVRFSIVLRGVRRQCGTDISYAITDVVRDVRVRATECAPTP